jgi:RecA-family ATPase
MLDKPDYFSDRQWEEHLKAQGKSPKRKLNGAHRHGGAREFPPSADEDEAAEAPLPKLVLHKRVKGRTREWNVPGWIPKRTPTLIQGDGGLGKSTLLQQWQSSCATNELWIGLSVEEIATLGVYTEDEDQDVDLRQDAIDDHYGLDCMATGKMHTLAMAGEDSEMVVFDRNGNPTPTKFYRQIAEAAQDYHVKGIGLDVAVDLYGGNEIARRQVRAFMRAIGKLGRMIDGPVIVTSHVSQAGIQSDGGHSASTDWSNASRSRAYLSAPKDGADGPVDPDARIFSRKKANHARIGETIKLKWQNGVFVPEVRAAASFYRRPAEDVFLALLDAVNSEGQKVSHKPKSGNYAPTAFMKRTPKDREDYQRGDFERAMQALLKHPQRIKIAPYGRPSWGNEEIVRAGAEEDLS